MENIVVTRFYKVETPQLTLIGDDKGMIHIQPNRGPLDTYSCTDLESAIDEYYRVWNDEKDDMFDDMKGNA